VNIRTLSRVTAPLADRLLDAHVAWTLTQLKGTALAAVVAEEVDHALAGARALTLDDVVDRDSVKAVARKYVATFDLPGAIPDLAGEIALRVRTRPANHVLVGEVFPRREVEAVVATVAQLRTVRESIADNLAESPGVRSWLADVMHSMTTGTIAANRRAAERIPGMGSAFSIAARLGGGALRGADQISREVAERSAGALLRRWRESFVETMDDARLTEALLDVWDGLAAQPMSSLVEAIDEDELVDLIVVGYDVWLKLRGAEYLHSLVDTGIDYVFDTYGTTTLAELLDEFGLTRDDLLEEALRFAPKAIDALERAGLLEDLIRRRLAPFYASAEVQTLLAEG
jgi:hypothetical protein